LGTGNKPPWTLPAKGAYSKYDSERAKQYFGLENVKTPPFFPILSLLPQRVLGYVKEAHPRLFTTTFIDIYEAMWQQGKDVSKPDVLAETLGKRFSEEDTRQIVDGANSPAYKQRLNDSTKAALDRGAFGCPWFWVRNSRGEEEPFFGSDRYVWPLSAPVVVPVTPVVGQLVQSLGPFTDGEVH
jgi:glutathione S-transferase kappa 1